MPNDVHSLSHTKWNCKYHIVFVPKYRRKAFINEQNPNPPGSGSLPVVLFLPSDDSFWT